MLNLFSYFWFFHIFSPTPLLKALIICSIILFRSLHSLLMPPLHVRHLFSASSVQVLKSIGETQQLCLTPLLCHLIYNSYLLTILLIHLQILYLPDFSPVYPFHFQCIQLVIPLNLFKCFF